MVPVGDWTLQIKTCYKLWSCSGNRLAENWSEGEKLTSHLKVLASQEQSRSGNWLAEIWSEDELHT